MLEIVKPCREYLESYYEACVVTKGHVHEDYIMHDPDKYDEWKILTCRRIQQTFLAVLKRRRVKKVIEEYWLLTDEECSEVDGFIKVSLFSEVQQANAHAHHTNEHVKQSNPIKVKESKDNIKLHCASGDALFEKLWKEYPNKKGKARVSDKDKRKLNELGEEVMMRCIQRYLEDLKTNTWKQPQNGSTFFHSGYVDYLDGNYSAPAKKPATTNKFNNFSSRTEDFNELAKDFIAN